jgi:hypothetical protein
VPCNREPVPCVWAGDGATTGDVDVSCSVLAANAGASELATTKKVAAVESIILSCRGDACIVLFIERVRSPGLSAGCN